MNIDLSKRLPTLHELQERYTLDEKRGVLIHKIGGGSRRRGSVVGTIRNKRRRRLRRRYVWLNGRHFPAEYLVWTMANGSIPRGYDVVHASEDRADNRLGNLVLVECERLPRSLGGRKHGESGHKGVTWRSDASLWVARMAGKYLGSFKTFEEALQARLDEEVKRGNRRVRL